MKKHNSSWMALAALLAGLGMTSNAHAVWTFNTIDTVTLNPNGIKDTASSTTVSLSAVSVKNQSTTNIGKISSSATWVSASLTDQNGSGVGICTTTNDTTSGSCGSPDHAVDNSTSTEAVLLNFSSSIVLSSIGFGWVSDNNSNTSNDTVDVSLFRWVGTGTPTGSPTALVGQNASSMTGWELVGNYGSMIADTTNNPDYNKVNTGNTGNAGAGGLGSSWWMISAYNSGYTATAKETLGSGFDLGNDYFKLYAVAGTACTSTAAGVCGPGTQTPGTIPEPGSLALASLALFGVIYTRRKVQAKH